MRMHIYSVLYICLFFAVLAQTHYIESSVLYFDAAPLLHRLVASLGLVCFLIFLPCSNNSKNIRSFLCLFKACVILIVLLLIVIECFIVDFSGKTFGVDFFYHLEIQSLVLGVKEYWPVILISLIGIGGIIFLILTNKLIKRGRINLSVFVASLIVIVIFFNVTVVGRFFLGLTEYTKQLGVQTKVDLSLSDAIEKLLLLGVDGSPLVKNNIEILKKGNGRNIIVVYLESFSHVFTTSDRYPNLTPFINQLKKSDGELTSYYSTAGFTMDGLISSNCGFMPNMALGNNALVSTSMPYFHLPCATDVLKESGYHQEFIGGAKKSFANKDGFLRAHGYDRVWGWEDFEASEDFKGKNSKSWWGLHDDDLFSFSKERIIELQQADQPYHLGILTLSTHLKGFSSPSCNKYLDGSHRYINAIHCLDRLLGEFITDLQDMHLLENTTVIVTADHGVFRTPLTKELFGDGVASKKILGIIIDENPDDIETPMALYDLGPTVLELLQIEHNVNFLLGESYANSTNDRTLISRYEVFNNGSWRRPNKECNEAQRASVLGYSFDLCALPELIKASYDFTGTFSLDLSIIYGAGSELAIVFKDNYESITNVQLNNTSLIGGFRRSGFVVENKHLKGKGLFILFFEPVERKLLNLYNFGIKNKDLERIAKLIDGNANIPFILFSPAHKENHKVLNNFKNVYSLECLSENVCSREISVVGEVIGGIGNTKVMVSFK